MFPQAQKEQHTYIIIESGLGLMCIHGESKDDVFLNHPPLGLF